jgi:hypothetical protein
VISLLKSPTLDRRLASRYFVTISDHWENALTIADKWNPFAVRPESVFAGRILVKEVLRW